MLLLIAQAASEVVLNKDEFSPMLIGQLIQIALIVVALIGGYKFVRRNPPLAEMVIAVTARVASLEERAGKIEARLSEGDGIIRGDLAEMAGTKAMVEAIKEDLHFIKTQMGTVLANINHNQRSK